MTDGETVIAVTVSQRGWSAELIRHLIDYGGARLGGTALTGDDALRQDYDVLIIDDIASYFSPRLVEKIHQQGRRVVGVYDGERGATGRERLAAAGVDGVAEADAGPNALLELALQVSPRLPESVPLPPEIMTSSPLGVTAVAGGDLAGDVALALGGTFASLWKVLVLDADTVAPCLAQRLSMPIVPNLLTALDSLVQLRGSIDDSMLSGPDGVTLMTGIPEASEWETIRSEDIADLVTAAAQRFDRVVVKISPYIEDLSRLGSRDGRFEVSRSLLRLAGEVALLAEPTPLGLSRAISWISQAQRLTSGRLHVLFENAPLGAFERSQLSDELTRTFPPSSITWLPADPARARAAWNGTPVPRGAFRKTVHRLGQKMIAAVL